MAKDLFAKEFYKQLENALEKVSNKEDLLDTMSFVFHNTFLELDNDLKSCEYVGSTCTSVFVWKHKGKTLMQAANVGNNFLLFIFYFLIFCIFFLK